jgi:hypothetical protein
MTTKWPGIYGAVLLVVATLVACGDDKGGDGGGGGGGSGSGSGGGGGGSRTSAGSAICNTECEMQGAKGCLVVGSIEACKDVCGGIKQLPASCYQALEATSQCRVANDDACATAEPDPCAAEFDAVVAGCGI